MQKSAVYCFFLLSLIFLIFGLAVTTAAEAHAESTEKSVGARIVVQVLDITPAQKTANVKIIVYIDNFPYNLTSLTPLITGNGNVEVVCNNMVQTGKESWWFSGESNETAWFLEGVGETYPFDSYIMRFRLQHDSLYPGINCSLTSNYSGAYFSGPKIISLETFGFETIAKFPQVGV